MMNDKAHQSAKILNGSSSSRLPREFFQAMVEATPIAMIMVNPEGDIVLVNAETERLFGYERHELLDQPIDKLVPERFRGKHPGHRTGFIADSSARLMGGGRDLFALRKDGSEFPVEIGLNPVEAEEETFVVCAVVDLTERKRMQQRFQSTVESAPMAMVMIDRSGRIVLVNTETERLFGYTRDDLIGETVEALVPEQFRGQHPGHRTGFFAHSEARRMGAGRDLYAQRKDGSIFPVEIGLNPVETDDGLFVLSAITDITERKNLEEAREQIYAQLEVKNDELAQKTRLLESVVESIGEGLVAVDTAGEYVVFNTEAQKIVGNDGETTSSQSGSIALFYEDQETRVPDDELPIVRALNGERVDDVIMYIRNEHEADGVFVHVTARPRLSGEGTIEGAVAAFRDITRLKKTEEELKIRNDEMEQFVYTVSHDLKSPLVTSKGFLGLMKEDLSDGNLDDVMDSVGRIENAANRMTNLIDDLLNLSRVGRLKNDAQPIDMEALFNKIKNQFAHRLEEKGISMTIAENIPGILADPSAIERVFENLIVNAIKYGCHGDAAQIEVGARREKKELLYFVRDNGPGIAPQYHEKIFGIFQRLDLEQEGTGIGLAITAKIATVHGGRIWVESTPGNGATFWVALPAELELNDAELAN